MFLMGGTHFVELGFQLTHIPLHFLYGGSAETERKKKRFLKSTVDHDSVLSTSLTFRDVKLDDGKTHCGGIYM